MDFMHDALAGGQRLRLFTLIDVYSRECLALVPSRIFSGASVAEILAGMDAALTVVDIQAMTPLTTEGYESAAPAMFALEVPQGWFAAHGIAVGSTAELIFGS